MSQDTQNLQQASKFVNKVTEDKLNTQEGAVKMVMLQALMDLAKPRLKKEAIERFRALVCTSAYASSVGLLLVRAKSIQFGLLADA